MSYQEYRPSSFNILPVVIKNLLIINAILWFAEYVLRNTFGFSLNMRFGLYYPLSENFQPIQYITHLFLHGGIMHLLSNMFVLWMFGMVLENLWGPKRFLIYYFVTGLGAALIHTIFTWYEIQQLWGDINQYAAAPNIRDFVSLIQDNSSYTSEEFWNELNVFIYNWKQFPGSSEMVQQSIYYATQLAEFKMNIPTVGASGAVFGVLLAIGVLFPNNLIYLYFAIPIKVKYFVFFYGLFELYNGVVNIPGDNVAHFAHLGGMLFGYILIKFWNKTNRKYFY